jgi:lysozyme
MVRKRRRLSRSSVLIAAAVIAATALVVLRAIDTRDTRDQRPALPDCPLGPTTPGIDVSYYQGDISWSRVRRAGVRFAFIRVADGATLLDTKFEANWSGAQRAGVLRGAYQFFRPNESPIDQAKVVIETLRTHGTGELPPVIDIEVSGGLPLTTVAANARVWIDHVRTELGVEPIVYTNFGVWRAGGAEPLATQPLWLAHYTNECPAVPPPWGRWTMWQYTDNGYVDGIGHRVDLDLFDGTFEDFRRRFAR